MLRPFKPLRDPDHDLTKLMASFRQEDEGNSIELIQTNGSTTGIYIQSRLQKAMFECCGEAINFDFTHSTNDLGYKLGSFMVTGPDGVGFSVLDVWIQSESNFHVYELFRMFKDLNPTFNAIKVFVVDKDFVEMSSLRDSFPEAVVLLCQFHVIKYLGKCYGNPD